MQLNLTLHVKSDTVAILLIVLSDTIAIWPSALDQKPRGLMTALLSVVPVVELTVLRLAGTTWKTCGSNVIKSSLAARESRDTTDAGKPMDVDTG